MSIQTHIDSLTKKRTQLKQRIAEESAHPAPDLVLITNLKKQNLALKEEMRKCLSTIDAPPKKATS
ncbi:MAG: YdcH family protein [Rickettsiales bacterium]